MIKKIIIIGIIILTIYSVYDGYHKSEKINTTHRLNINSVSINQTVNRESIILEYIKKIYSL